MPLTFSFSPVIMPCGGLVMALLRVKQSSFDKLFHQTIANFDNEKETVKSFYDFLLENSLVGEEKPSIFTPYTKPYIEVDDLRYERLKEVIYDLFRYLMNEDELVDNDIFMTNMLQYIYLAYYRAFIDEKMPAYDNDSLFSYGLSPKRAREDVFGEKGLLNAYCNYCLAKKLTNQFMSIKGKNDSFPYLHGLSFLTSGLHYEDVVSFIKNMNNQEFSALYTSYKRMWETRDYRLYNAIFLRFYEKEDVKRELSKEEYSATVSIIEDNLDAISSLVDENRFIDFQEYREKEYTSAILGLTHFVHFPSLNKEEASLLEDLRNFSPTEDKVSANMKAILKSLPEGTISVFGLEEYEKLFNEEIERRNELQEEKAKGKGKEIEKETLDKLPFQVNSFLKDGKKADYHYPEAIQASPLEESFYKNLARKIKKDARTYQSLASIFKLTQKSGAHQNMVAPFYVDSALNVLEEMMKREILSHYGDFIYLDEKKATLQTSKRPKPLMQCGHLIMPKSSWMP